jgi:hypothetical protein
VWEDTNPGGKKKLPFHFSLFTFFWLYFFHVFYFIYLVASCWVYSDIALYGEGGAWQQKIWAVCFACLLLLLILRARLVCRHWADEKIKTRRLGQETGASCRGSRHC